MGAIHRHHWGDKPHEIEIAGGDCRLGPGRRRRHAASAKTLVYCSEGSPENFYPAINTTGTSFDASSRPIYNRLVEFERGSTKIEPGLATSWDATEDGMGYTLHLP